MSLQLPPDSPAWMPAAAAGALLLHIGGGAGGLISGAIAIGARKGEAIHRGAGTVFFVSMLLMAGVGAIIAPLLPVAKWTNTTAGAFTFYLVATAWATVRRGESRSGAFEIGAFVFAAAIALMGVGLALLYGATPRAGGFVAVWIFCAVAALAAACDLRVILAGGIAGKARIARHLWRMCLALFIAAGSFFVGQQKIMPEVVRGHPALFAPMLIVFALMIYWLVLLHFSRPKPAEAV
jgi:hypothetical protein